MAKMTDVLARLLKNTEEDKVGWDTTADPEKFSAIVGTMEATISRIPGRGNGDEYRLAILNEAGTEIDWVSSYLPSVVPRLPQFPGSLEFQLKRLHDLARRRALDAEGTLDRFLERLEGL